MAMERIIAHFLTNVEIQDADDDAIEKWENYLSEVVDVIAALQCSHRNRACYGSDFSSVIVPFKRFLACPQCGSSYPLATVYNGHAAFKFEFKLPQFIASCPVCRLGSKPYRGPWKLRDLADDEERKIKIKIWNPHEIELLHDPFTEDVAYLWRIPEDYKLAVKKGKLWHLERVGEKVLGAIHKNQTFRFHPDVIFHMKEPTLAGHQNRGWGIPRILTNFRQIWYVEVLRRMNEAIALDYVIPTRVITPAQRQSGVGNGMAADPLLMYSGSDFGAQVRAGIRRKRRDPASYMILPFPVDYQMFGAEASQLAGRDLMDQGQETLLNEAGTPAELYNGSLSLQATVPALRLMERTWYHLVHDSNAYLRWLVRQTCQILSWEPVKARLQPTTIADDMEKLMMDAQLYMSQQLSGTTAMRALNHDWRHEQRQIADEAVYQAELQARTQEKMEQAGFAQQIAKGQQAAGQGQGAPAPGAPAAQGQAPQGDPSQQPAPPGPVSQYLAGTTPNTPTTLDDITSAAQGMAQGLLGLPEAVKDTELRKLRIANKPMHAMVLSQMGEIRQQVKSQAGNAAMGQMQQQGGAPQ